MDFKGDPDMKPYVPFAIALICVALLLTHHNRAQATGKTPTSTQKPTETSTATPIPPTITATVTETLQPTQIGKVPTLTEWNRPHFNKTVTAIATLPETGGGNPRLWLGIYLIAGIMLATTIFLLRRLRNV